MCCTGTGKPYQHNTSTYSLLARCASCSARPTIATAIFLFRDGSWLKLDLSQSEAWLCILAGIFWGIREEIRGILGVVLMLNRPQRAERASGGAENQHYGKCLRLFWRFVLHVVLFRHIIKDS